jgi:uncharacterized protein YlzI (FlbEa/FlbD family)
MISLTGLNGEAILVAAHTVFRIRPATPSEAGEAVKAEYSGGYIYTREALDSLLDRIAAAGVRMVRLTTRSGVAVHLNVAAITRVREALSINGPGTELVVAGQYQHVTESVAEVRASIEAAS